MYGTDGLIAFLTTDIQIRISAIKGTFEVELREIIRNRQYGSILLVLGRVHLKIYKAVVLKSGMKCDFLI